MLSQKLYFYDGNILLDVVEDDEKTRFRVHKSILVRSSEFFANMFKVTQPTDEVQELVDGCPVVNSTGDFIDDWETILGALYNPSLNKAQQSAQNIIAMLRIGQKYQFDDFFEDAQTRLRECCPSSLNEFRRRGTSRSDPEDAKTLLDVAHEGIIPDDVFPALYFDNFALIVCNVFHASRQLAVPTTYNISRMNLTPKNQRLHLTSTRKLSCVS
ncbi:hypothetical protein AN958_05719 [Leucoagaricus sp. SymC.cos]|nr:hypothetical protein AN958_05719 [Leucoagaricus sp. SymC.cos]